MTMRLVSILLMLGTVFLLTAIADVTVLLGLTVAVDRERRATGLWRE